MTQARMQLIRAAKNLYAAAGRVTRLQQAMYKVLEEDGHEIGDELLGPSDQKRSSDAEGGDLDDAADNGVTRTQRAWADHRVQLLSGENYTEPSQAKAQYYAGFRQALTTNRRAWASEATLASSLVSRARSTLLALADQYDAESEVLSARIESRRGSGEAVCSIELETLTESTVALISLARSLDYPADMRLMPDRYDVVIKTVFQLWDQIMSLCMEYDEQATSLTDIGRTLEFLACVPYERRTRQPDEEE